MEQLLEKLLEAEVLSKETKKELEEAFNTQLKEAIEAAKQEAAADVRAELTEQWYKDRDTLIEAIDKKVGEFLENEIEELKGDVEKFRDLEAEYAEKIVEAKGAMSNELKNDLKELIEKIDAFLEIRLAAEVEELKEDIDAQRRNQFGRKIFEAFVDEFTSNYSDDESAEATVRELQQQLADTSTSLEESEKARAELEREIEMDKVLSPLSGRQKEVMEAILRNVDTKNLEHGYKTFIGRVIREAENESGAGSEKEEKVLAESASDTKDDETKLTEKAKDGIVKTGDKETLTESQKSGDADKFATLRRLAGIQ